MVIGIEVDKKILIGTGEHWVEGLHIQNGRYAIFGPNNTLVDELKEACCVICGKLAEKDTPCEIDGERYYDCEMAG